MQTTNDPHFCNCFKRSADDWTCICIYNTVAVPMMSCYTSLCRFQDNKVSVNIRHDLNVPSVLPQLRYIIVDLLAILRLVLCSIMSDYPTGAAKCEYILCICIYSTARYCEPLTSLPGDLLSLAALSVRTIFNPRSPSM